MNSCRRRLLGRLLAQAQDDLFGFVERRGVGPVIGHRKTVVQQHDVVQLAAAEQRAQFVLQKRLRHHQHRRRNGRNAQQQQQQLLEHHPSAVALLADEQKLHRRPFDPAMPHQIDQMDQAIGSAQSDADATNRRIGKWITENDWHWTAMNRSNRFGAAMSHAVADEVGQHGIQRIAGAHQP